MTDTTERDWSWAFRELDAGRAVQRPLPGGDVRRLEPTSREAPTVADLTSKQWGPDDPLQRAWKRTHAQSHGK